MQKQSFKDYKKLLEVKRNELIRATRERNSIYIEKAADEFDEVQLAMDRELAISNLDRGTTMLRDAEAALARIEDGHFGICLVCEEEILERRQNAIPWAAHCLSCQELLEQHHTGDASNEQIQFV
jgi:DnaK suppressor protein